MYTSTARKYFNDNSAACARAIGLTRSAVTQWKKVVPLDKAFALELATNGKLKVDKSLYPHIRRQAGA